MTNQLATYDEEYSKAAQQYAEDFQSKGGKRISTRAGILTENGHELVGNQILAVVLDAAYHNSYFVGAFDPDSPASPTCYAYARGSKNIEGMYPHESMQHFPEYFTPQNIDERGNVLGCNSCRWNVFGSASVGKGKACKQRVSLLLIPGGDTIPRKGSRDFDEAVYGDPKDYKDGERFSLQVPTTSMRAWEDYVATIGRSTGGQVGRPPYGVITRIYPTPMPNGGHKLNFEKVEDLPDAAFPVVHARHVEAMSVIMAAYSPPQEKEQAPQRGGLRGLRR